MTVAHALLIVGMCAVLAAWDIGRKLLAARAAHVTDAALDGLRAEVAAAQSRADAAHKLAHETKNRLEAAAAQAQSARKRWDASRPVKIG